jgi:hypothetical protein
MPIKAIAGDEAIQFAIAAMLLCGALWLMVQRWFWILAFFIGGLASAFATLASIIHFQILGALLFFFLMFICWGIMGFIASENN